MNNKWLQYFVYALSLVISLGLEIWHPDVRSMLCAPLPVGQGNSLDNYLTIDPSPSNPRSKDREK